VGVDAYTPTMRCSRRPTIAVVGCGRWGRNIVRDLVALDCSVIAIDPSEESRRESERLGASASHSSLSDHAGDPYRGIVVSAPTSAHGRLTHEALSFDVPVFVEKPLTDDLAVARKLVEAGGDRLFVMHKWHYHPGIAALADVAASGRLGVVVGVTSERTGTANPSNDTDAIWLLGPHELTIGRRILGSFADSITGVADLTDAGVVGAEAITRWEDGRWHRWSVSVRPSETRRTVTVQGSTGRAILERPDSTHIRLYDDVPAGVKASVNERSPSDVIAVAAELPLLRELRSFREHLTGGAPPPTTGADGLAVVTLLSSLRESAGLPAAGSLLRGGRSTSDSMN